MEYVISGTVIQGAGYGRKLGFPTVNLDVKEEELPPPGVYKGTAALDGREYRAGIVVGPGGSAEAHLMGYNGDAYGREVTLHIGSFIREFRKFDTEEELIAQITEDLKQC